MQQQAWLIELLAWWEGRVQPTQLARYWNYSRQSASKILKQYRHNHPGALEFDTGGKFYYPGTGFAPKLISRQAGEYLNWLSGYNAGQQHPLPAWSLQPPQRHITPGLMRPLVQALREGRRVDVEYGSVSSASREGRIIVPHHLVKTTTRWHLRAWCERSNEYRDFVLSRFHGIPELMDKSPQGAEQDRDWNTEVEIVLAADPRLNASKRAVIEQDYGMTDGRLVLSSKACMVNYLLQSLNLDPYKIEANAAAQQLVIVNLDDIKCWLFS